jgi:hypothetical protein
MREQENTAEPFGPPMITEVSAALDVEGKIVDWEYGVWSNTHYMRPSNGGMFLQNAAMPEPLPVPSPAPIPMPEGGGDRNSNPLYAFPNAHVVYHFVPTMPLRTSAMRSLGAFRKIFAIESFMDELAEAAGADPVAFRLRHMNDARARDVIQAAADRFGWSKQRPELRFRALQESRQPIVRLRWIGRSSTRPAVSRSDAWSLRWIAANPSTLMESETKSKAPSRNLQAGRFTNRFRSTAVTSGVRTGAVIPSFDFRRRLLAWTFMFLIVRDSPFSAPARRDRVQPQPRLPTLCVRQRALGCAICHCRENA